MKHLQLLRGGFPDMKFFGNTFVGLSLARHIKEGTIIAKPKHGLKDMDQWRNLAMHYFQIPVEYIIYAAHSPAMDHTIDNFVSKVEKEVNETGKLIINFHFPDSDLDPACCSKLPDRFGKEVAQYMHLHCDADFFFKNGKTRSDRIRWLDNAINKMLIKRFIAVSYEVRDSFAKYIPRDMMQVVPNGVDADIYSFRQEPEKRAFKNQFKIQGKFVIGYCGRLDTVKGYDDLIKIMQWFDKKPEFDVGFAIASSGGGRISGLESALEKQVPRLLSENRISFMLDVAKLVGERKTINQFSNDFFMNYLQENLLPKCSLYKGVTPVPLQAQCDVYIQPSYSEAIGLSVIEAIFTGTPVVAHRIGGIPEVVSEAYGHLVDFHPKMSIRVPNFCDAIIDLIEKSYGSDGYKDTSAYRRQVRDRLISTHSAQVMAAAVEKIYSEKN
jgi:glycosyltransferase involved in cell wall biosynthesis